MLRWQEQLRIAQSCTWSDTCAFHRPTSHVHTTYPQGDESSLERSQPDASACRHRSSALVTETVVSPMEEPFPVEISARKEMRLSPNSTQKGSSPLGCSTGIDTCGLHITPQLPLPNVSDGGIRQNDSSVPSHQASFSLLCQAVPGLALPGITSPRWQQQQGRVKGGMFAQLKAKSAKY